jgi:DNA mismatch repair protein MutS2
MIEGGNDTLIITGPNTGGKTVTLKTLGLFALMAQSGLHIPCDEGSELCIYDNIFADIGDAQSIEQSLSTFSSHMVSIVKMLDGITGESLVLFDELCAGTDPVEGAALAHSIIEAVRERGAMCMATTHYAELKAYALQTEGVTNASCEFDVATLKPTYKLIIGTPGKSNAFAISSKLGLDEKIVERAKAFIGSEDRNFETVIEKLEESRIQMERERLRAEELRVEYERFKADNEKILNRKLAEADRELNKAREKAVAMVQSAKASSDYILAEMDKLRKQRDSERLGDEVDEARRKMRAYLRDNESKYNPVEEKVDKEYVLPRPLRVGDEVYIVNIDKNGFVVEAPDKNGNVTVQAGIIKTKTKLKNLKLIENTPSFTDKSGKKAKATDYRATVSRDCKDEIDLRGMNGDEAWMKVDKYLDEAMLVGYHTVRLIHGKGTGALKKALWEYLRRDSRIKSYRIGQYGEGDGGVTVVELK